MSKPFLQSRGHLPPFPHAFQLPFDNKAAGRSPKPIMIYPTTETPTKSVISMPNTTLSMSVVGTPSLDFVVSQFWSYFGILETIEKFITSVGLIASSHLASSSLFAQSDDVVPSLQHLSIS
jgi:hypothetical protein